MFKKSPSVKFLYLAPKAAEAILKEYNADNKNSKDYYLGIITLTDFAKHVNSELCVLLNLIEKDSLKKNYNGK